MTLTWSRPLLNTVTVQKSPNTFPVEVESPETFENPMPDSSVVVLLNDELAGEESIPWLRLLFLLGSFGTDARRPNTKGSGSRWHTS